MKNARLDEFHFHVTNEHTIPGYGKARGRDAFVHTDPKIYVIALIEKSPEDNDNLTPFLDQLPINLYRCKEVKADLNPLLPRLIRGYYRSSVR